MGTLLIVKRLPTGHAVKILQTFFLISCFVKQQNKLPKVTGKAHEGMHVSDKFLGSKAIYSDRNKIISDLRCHNHATISKSAAYF
jgi:hypothetical protein